MRLDPRVEENRTGHENTVRPVAERVHETLPEHHQFGKGFLIEGG
jgi:hypothetical protein